MTMRFGLRALAPFAAVAVLSSVGCGGGGTTPGLRVLGKVSDPSGAPVKGVTVSAVGASAITDAAGRYDLRVTSAASELVLTFGSASYNQCVSVVPVSETSNTEQNVTLLPVSRQASVDPANATIVKDDRADGNNALVALPAGGIVTPTGSSLNTAKVKITTWVPGDVAYLESFPAQYVGVSSRAAGEKVPLITYGAVNVTLEDGAGQPAKLAGTATLRFPVSTSNDPALPTIPLWYLDTDTGVWVSHSDAVRDETTTPVTYKAEVNHFSWWVIAVFPSSSVTIRLHVVRDPADSPLVPVFGAQVQVRRERGAWQGRGATNANGRLSIIAPPPGPYDIRAQKTEYFDEGPTSVVTSPGYVDVRYWLRPLGTGAS
jgi:hypothetical protein